MPLTRLFRTLDGVEGPAAASVLLVGNTWSLDGVPRNRGMEIELPGLKISLEGIVRTLGFAEGTGREDGGRGRRDRVRCFA